MNKCLVTTLKAQTNNEALSKYNVLTIKIKATDSPTTSTQWIEIGTSSNGGISLNSSCVGLYKSGISGELFPYPHTISASKDEGHHFENKNGIIEVTGKYNLKKISFADTTNATVRIKEIYGIPGTIEKLIIHKIEDSEIDATKLFNTLNTSKLTDFILPVKGLYINANVINKLSKDKAVEFVNIKTTDITFSRLFENLGLDDLANNVNLLWLVFSYGLKAGNLSSLAKLTKLTRISFENYVQNNGDIMDFINPWIQASRTSGKIQVNWLLGQRNITLNGQAITYPSGVDNSAAYLNWTSDGTVTFTAS